jgi:hypothetical protein
MEGCRVLTHKNLKRPSSTKIIVCILGLIILIGWFLNHPFNSDENHSASSYQIVEETEKENNYIVRLLSTISSKEEFNLLAEELYNKYKGKKMNAISVYIYYPKEKNSVALGQQTGMIYLAFTKKGEQKMNVESGKKFRVDLHNETKPSEIIVEPPPQVLTLTPINFKNYIPTLKASMFIEDAFLEDSTAHIEYFSSYEDLKDKKPFTEFTEQEYNMYFDSNVTVENILISESIRLLYKFPQLKEVSMNLPFEGETYSLHLNRDDLNEFLGFKLTELNTQDGSWTNKIIKPYLYEEESRQLIVSKFITIE